MRNGLYAMNFSHVLRTTMDCYTGHCQDICLLLSHVCLPPPCVIPTSYFGLRPAPSQECHNTPGNPPFSRIPLFFLSIFSSHPLPISRSTQFLQIYRLHIVSLHCHLQSTCDLHLIDYQFPPLNPSECSLLYPRGLRLRCCS